MLTTRATRSTRSAARPTPTGKVIHIFTGNAPRRPKMPTRVLFTTDRGRLLSNGMRVGARARGRTTWTARTRCGVVVHWFNATRDTTTHKLGHGPRRTVTAIIRATPRRRARATARQLAITPAAPPTPPPTPASPSSDAPYEEGEFDIPLNGPITPCPPAEAIPPPPTPCPPLEAVTPGDITLNAGGTPPPAAQADANPTLNLDTPYRGKGKPLPTPPRTPAGWPVVKGPSTSSMYPTAALGAGTEILEDHPDPDAEAGDVELDYTICRIDPAPDAYARTGEVLPADAPEMRYRGPKGKVIQGWVWIPSQGYWAHMAHPTPYVVKGNPKDAKPQRLLDFHEVHKAAKTVPRGHPGYYDQMEDVWWTPETSLPPDDKGGMLCNKVVWYPPYSRMGFPVLEPDPSFIPQEYIDGMTAAAAPPAPPAAAVTAGKPVVPTEADQWEFQRRLHRSMRINAIPAAAGLDLEKQIKEAKTWQQFIVTVQAAGKQVEKTRGEVAWRLTNQNERIAVTKERLTQAEAEGAALSQKRLAGSISTEEFAVKEQDNASRIKSLNMLLKLQEEKASAFSRALKGANAMFAELGEFYHSTLDRIA